MRSLLLFLARRRLLRRWMEQSSTATLVTRRFVAGRSLDDAISVCAALAAERMFATIDRLGENVTSVEEAAASRDTYLGVLERIAAASAHTTISIKLTQFGMDLSEQACRENVTALAERASRLGTRVEVDMESHQYVDRTLRLAVDLHQRFDCIRAVIQSYLYRSEADIEALCDARVPVRLCKGAYLEPHTVAFPRKQDVDANYMKLGYVLLDRGANPAFATHDEKIIRAIQAYARLKDISPESFEFQMLYGIRRDLQRELAREGYRVRLYVPYGTAWYPYFMRRLAERPANILFLARNLLRR
ncbi:MAG: proline dehydrogenase family protein [Bryobacteraceae bacterium]